MSMSSLPGFTALVGDARSNRRFVEADPVPAALLREFVSVARLAPSGRNQQSLRFLIVNSPEKRAVVFPHVKWAAALKWKGPQPGERATGFIFLLKPAGGASGHDAGIAAMTIKLAAASAGYASVILGALDRPALQKVLAVPAGLEIDIAVAIGRAGETVVLENLAPGQPFDYWRDDAGVHHVPKRPLEELIVRTAGSD